MSLSNDVQAAFAADGLLSRAVTHFVARSGQTEMAIAVAQAIENAEALFLSGACAAQW